MFYQVETFTLVSSSDPRRRMMACMHRGQVLESRLRRRRWPASPGSLPGSLTFRTFIPFSARLPSQAHYITFNPNPDPNLNRTSSSNIGQNEARRACDPEIATPTSQQSSWFLLSHLSCTYLQSCPFVCQLSALLFTFFFFLFLLLVLLARFVLLSLSLPTRRYEARTSVWGDIL